MAVQNSRNIRIRIVEIIVLYSWDFGVCRIRRVFAFSLLDYINEVLSSVSSDFVVCIPEKVVQFLIG